MKYCIGQINSLHQHRCEEVSISTLTKPQLLQQWFLGSVCSELIKIKAGPPLVIVR